MAFARSADLVAVATRLSHRLAESGGWSGTTLILPPGRWRPVHGTPTGGTHEGRVELAKLLTGLPATALVRVG